MKQDGLTEKNGRARITGPWINKILKRSVRGKFHGCAPRPTKSGVLLEGGLADARTRRDGSFENKMPLYIRARGQFESQSWWNSWNKETAPHSFVLMQTSIDSFLGNLPDLSLHLRGVAISGFLENQASRPQVGALALPNITMTDWGSFPAVPPGLGWMQGFQTYI